MANGENPIRICFALVAVVPGVAFKVEAGAEEAEELEELHAASVAALVITTATTAEDLRQACLGPECVMESPRPN
jgi:hypothetical protein